MTLSISALVDNYLNFMRNVNSCSVLTLKAYRGDLEQAYGSDNFWKTSLLDFTPLVPGAKRALNQWARLSLASRNRKIATLKSFFNWLYKEKMIETNFAHQLICPKVPKKIPHFLSVDEVIAVLKVYRRPQLNLSDLRELTLFSLLYGAGLRISEACNLEWKSISWSQRRMIILGKGDKERIVVLPRFSLVQLKELHDAQGGLAGTDFVFGGEAALNPRTGYEMIRQCGAKAGLMQPLHPHALRHSFATHLLTSGANLRTLQKLLGHESLTATEKYVHLNVDALARTLESTHPLSKLKSEGTP